jgi:ABC-type nickel/cobalt efflux system permease component RcnA
MRTRFRGRRLLLLPIALISAFLGTLQLASAHPLGNFTISHYSELTFGDDRVTLAYAVDMAEIPTFQVHDDIDPDGDGTLSQAEIDAYLETELPNLVENLELTVAGERLELATEQAAAFYRDGQGGLPTLFIEARLTAELPAGWQQDSTGTYRDGNFESRLGWREIVVRGGEGIAIAATDALTESITGGLNAYPDDRLSSPLDMRDIGFTLEPAIGAPAPVPATDRATEAAESTRRWVPSGRGATDRLTARLAEADLTPGLIAVLLFLATGWGALHALSPGHGKAVVAAYLVGTRGTAKHAGVLGLTVTLTHTAGVFLLAVVTLSLSHFILPEDLYPWLGVGSGALVVAIGATLLYGRLRSMLRRERDGGTVLHDHSDPNHAHSHVPPSTVTTRGLLAMGVSGGLVPCPSALILLLSSISLDRLELGIALVIAFSLGLAAVLVAIGLLVVYARWIFRRFSFELRVPRILPAASAAAISIAGLLIVYQSLYQTGLI